MSRVKWKRDRDYPVDYWEPWRDEVEVTRCGYITMPQKLRKLVPDMSKLVLICHGGWYAVPQKRWTIKVPYEPYDHLSLAVFQDSAERTSIVVHKIGPYDS